MVQERSQLAVTVSHVDGAPVVTLAGEIDLAVLTTLRRAMTRAATNADRVMVDLRDVSFIDASGIDVLVDAARMAGAVVLLDPQPIVEKVIHLTGADGVFSIERR